MKEKAIITNLITEFFSKNIKGFDDVVSSTMKRYRSDNMDAEYLRGVIHLREVPCLVHELDEIDPEIVQFIQEGKFNETYEDKIILKRVIVLCEIKKLEVKLFNDFYSEYTKDSEKIAENELKQLIDEEKSFQKLKIEARNEMRKNPLLLEDFQIIQKATGICTAETATYRELAMKTIIIYKIHQTKTKHSEEEDIEAEKLTYN